MHSTTADWDARTYDRLAAPQEEWARGSIPRLGLSGAESVLDAGCGTGRVTRLLLDELPRGRVIGIDGSLSMIGLAREKLAAELGDRVALITSDLLDLDPELLEREAGAGEVDAVFSNATFHWIADHRTLFERLRSVMAPGARLVTQCGGRGNVPEWVAATTTASERPPFAEYVGGFEPWNFRGPEETAALLTELGFSEVHCWLEKKPTEPTDPRGYTGAASLAAHHERLPAELREPFTDAVMEDLPAPLVVHYVRLNIDARADG